MSIPEYGMLVSSVCGHMPISLLCYFTIFILIRPPATRSSYGDGTRRVSLKSNRKRQSLLCPVDLTMKAKWHRGAQYFYLIKLLTISQNCYVVRCQIRLNLFILFFYNRPLFYSSRQSSRCHCCFFFKKCEFFKR